MSKKKGMGHVGKMHRGGMHLKSVGGKDQHASDLHHQMNKKHGMGQGFCPPEEYQGGDPKESGAPEMDENDED